MCMAPSWAFALYAPCAGCIDAPNTYLHAASVTELHDYPRLLHQVGGGGGERQPRVRRGCDVLLGVRYGGVLGLDGPGVSLHLARTVHLSILLQPRTAYLPQQYKTATEQ